MKSLKINWGTGVVIAIVAFIVFILSFVYKTLAFDEYHHELVSDDYYKEELHYQQEIDKMNKAKALEEQLEIQRNDKGLVIIFPSTMASEEIRGEVQLKRPSNAKLDYKMALMPKEGSMLIPDEHLVEGKWLVIVDWQHGEEAYLVKEELFY